MNRKLCLAAFVVACIPFTQVTAQSAAAGAGASSPTTRAQVKAATSASVKHGDSSLLEAPAEPPAQPRKRKKAAAKAASAG